MCEVASYILEYIILKDIAISHNKYGMNILWMPFDDNTKLDTTEAKMIVSKWYEKGNNYNYDNEPPNTKTGKFIVIYHMMLIIMFLELFVYCYMKCRNKLTIYTWVLF